MCICTTPKNVADWVVLKHRLCICVRLYIAITKEEEVMNLRDGGQMGEEVNREEGEKKMIWIGLLIYKHLNYLKKLQLS